MNQAWYIILAFAFHRDNVTALTNGDNRFPQEFGIGRRGNDLLQTVTDLAGLNAHMAADIRQRGGCRICNFFLRQDGTENFIFQLLVGRQCAEQRIQHRLYVILRNITLGSAGAAKDPGNAQQFLGL